jgi:formate C-acetyltransferase
MRFESGRAKEVFVVFVGAVAQAIAPPATTSPNERAWRGLKPGPWRSHINLRVLFNAIVRPTKGTPWFLAGVTARTRKVWVKLPPLLAQKREKGVVDVSQTIEQIGACTRVHRQECLEPIVGLQTAGRLKRAIMLKGKWKVVEASLKVYDFEPDPAIKKVVRFGLVVIVVAPLAWKF